ncbi:hypothetical protein D6D01_09689 [Aureobasidium pullulans]|uniref:Uncharacterized protein n=1 Tax=Aureobasidium pullulans TaxID=5580 RepID=A0A4S9JZ45_AURPU|nr:hypothetical protein D6D01_09689 [Aureobasidium pullulans]
MSSTEPGYFARFNAFTHDPQGSVRDEFNRLAKTQKWHPKEKERQRAHCYNEELEGHFKSLNIHDKLDRLKYLCTELDVKPQDTIAECKQALRNVNVNLVDLMDARRACKRVKQFATHKELVHYTKSAEKQLPRSLAKGEVVESLLRHIEHPKY